MPGKPFQSKLKPYESEMREILASGVGYRGAAQEINRRHGLDVSHNAVFSFLKSRPGPCAERGLFYEGLPTDLRDQLLKRLAAEWTHESTAIEGNTLTLGETVKILELGLTIGGKPLRDHQEVYGHARAIDLIYEMVGRALTREDLFALHRAVMPLSAWDSLNPVGDWKKDFNGTTGVVDGKSVYMEYAAPADVPRLMERWLTDFNKTRAINRPAQAVAAYVRTHIVFVRIHPFFDGNGRMARLIANLPVLAAGFPPILVPMSRRSDYIDLLWRYQNAVGRIGRGSRLLPPHPALHEFESLLLEEWQKSTSLVEEANQLAKQRR
jgi:fido (protein-threonine AMPylation protein)